MTETSKLPGEPIHRKVVEWMGDIGTHAAQLAEYISGLKITKLCRHQHRS
jgi:hypothetical protein